MKRVVVVCPGRGSYGREQLGSLRGAQDLPSVMAADAMREALGRPTPSAMDASASYSSRLHVAGENASSLSATCSLADHDRLLQAGRVKVVAVIGNSMGWYTALTAAGALDVPHGLRLIETMGQYQAENVPGGQILYPLCDADWNPLPSPEVDELLRHVPGLFVSIRLGRQLVLGGTDEALRIAMTRLPARRIGDRDAPFQLPLHSAFHTPLLLDTAGRAARDLMDLGFQAPRVPMVDGVGKVWFPLHADPHTLGAYTLGTQVVAPFDFGLCVRTALREFAPDALVLLGPGGNLGSAVAQAMLDEHWSNLRTRADFQRRQEEDPIVWSLTRPEQRRLALGEP